MMPTHDGLHVFADGSFEPNSGYGGWAFAAYRDGEEIASVFGGGANSANNEMEVSAVLKAVSWINTHARAEDAVVWSDSVYAVTGSNQWRHIWKNNGWKKIVANKNKRGRTVPFVKLWQELDFQLLQNPKVSVAWCKGHVGIPGNEKADELADCGSMLAARSKAATR
ncbi:ribonuclease HI [Pararhizobium capsulatum DSM 1112]|uniref:ribonuclease H n=1 Tax=Pararhizobium capsulatum DSM 1112 TaxID=1121113 RepID=A0ABU0BZ15_9HYPH|nr:ribonuclease H [Pararhizobium capsulatum]MDQ0322911.1 ribonuclease HI [Pararhizobium capsulatum DSM 1112]